MAEEEGDAHGSQGIGGGRRISEQPRAQTGVAQDPNSPVTWGNVLMLFEESRKYHDEKLQGVLDAVSQLTATTQVLSTNTNQIMENINSRGLTPLSNASPRAGSSSRKSSEGRKRKHPEKIEDLPFLSFIQSVDKTPFFVKWSTGFTINSFARSYPAIWKWLPDQTRNYHAPHSGLIGNASGLSLLFFSTEFGVARGRVVPEWMDAFGGRGSTSKYVWNYCMILDSTKKILSKLPENDSYVRAKRARTEGPVDKYGAAKDFAICTIRQIIRNSLSYGRTESRKHLAEGVMFLVDKIKTFGSRELAKNAGFEVQFVEEESEAESVVPLDVSGTIWDIEDCATTGGTEAELQKTNNALLKKVAGDFPSLFLKLKWPRLIIPDDGVSPIPSGVPRYWNETQAISLHEISLKILTSMSLAAKDTKLVMRSSKLTLKALHILAIGLRGLVRQFLGLEPSALEKSAMGSMTAHGPEEEEDIEVVSAKLGKRTSKNVQKSTAVDTIRNEKFTIKYNEYLKKDKENQDAQRRLEQGSTRSEGGISPQPSISGDIQQFPDEDDDDAEKSGIDEPHLV